MERQVQPTILIVDDSPENLAILNGLLQPSYRILAATSGERALAVARAEPRPDLVLLDVMMPGLDGFEVLKQIRRDSAVPVLMLTSRGDEADRIVGLEMGADDYLPKTFSPRELLARLRAVTRRSRPSTATAAGTAGSQADPDAAELVVRDLHVNPATRTAVIGDKPIALTAVEFDLLLCLVRAPGRVKTREQLLEEVRDRDYEVFDRSIDVHISALRKKLGDDPRTPRFIETIRSVGYRMIHPDL